MKRIFVILVLALVLSFCAACTAAPIQIEKTVTYSDGSYMIVTVKDDENTYSATREETPEQLNCLTASQDNYRLHLLCQATDFGDHSSGYAYWGNNPVFKTELPQHYIDWIETEDGDMIPVWRDRNGNMLYNTKFATKHCSYYSADDRLLWTMSVTAMFKRNNVDHYCEVVSGNITIWEKDSWYVIMENVDDEADSASYTVQFGRKNLGVTIAEPTYTVTLSRDENGDFH